MKRFFAVLLLLVPLCLVFAQSFRFPALVPEMKPWTRWWWHGSAVDSSRIAELLEEYAAVGFGGLEITSIYGAKGYEERFIPYLSEKYLDMLLYSAETAKRLNMGVDIPPGSGWRCGGPLLEIEFADAALVVETFPVKPGETFEREFRSTPQALMAFHKDFSQNLLPLLHNNKVVWKPNSGQWTVYTVSQKWSGANVKRAAPGGEGYSSNPYSQESTEHMLEPFSNAFESFPHSLVRGLFHDSFEYSGNWCADFFQEFQKERGYDLAEYLPALLGNDNPERARRVKCDYRQTISDLVLNEFILPLKEWSNDRGWLLRNQSHGSPANLLDVYGAVDIPETEIFRFDRNPHVLKFASSPAHILDKKLVSAESFTWQDEHFTVTLDTMKRSVDLLFSAGINHVFFHGTAYSPADAKWPGWVFYASSQINPQNPIWHDLDALNNYIARSQSLLQTSAPDNDVLVYWPVYDIWSDTSGLNKKLAVHHPQWITENPAGHVARQLDKAGIQYDFISDKQLQQAQVQDSLIQFPGSFYSALVIPHCEWMPLETIRIALDLAKNGAHVVVENDWPNKVPGLASWQQRQKILGELLAGLEFSSASQNNPVKTGNIIAGLSNRGIRGESLAKFPKLLWLRKRSETGSLYFLANHGERDMDQWLELGTAFNSAAILDPLSGRTGIAQIQNSNRVRLQLPAGAALFIQTSSTQFEAEPWPYVHPIGQGIPLTDEWQIEFIKGGPVFPEPIQTKELKSWTEFEDDEGKRFAGTARYSLRFDSPRENYSEYMLDIGNVAESAEVYLNGEKLATLFTSPFQTLLLDVKPENNVLEIHVTNLAANRIRDLDRRDVPWQMFYDINFVNIEYQPFDASEWPLRPSGLIGPVTLLPIKIEATP